MEFFDCDWWGLILFSKIYMETSDVTQLPEKRNEAKQTPFLMFEKSMILRAEKIISETGICDYLKKGEKCLDIGTGMGYIAKEIVRKMKSKGEPVTYVIGIDNRFAFSSNLRNGNDEDSLLKFVNADAKELPFPDKSFDNVSFFFSFHHMSKEGDIECSLREALRVLKDNGKIFVAEDIVETPEERENALAIDRMMEIGEEREYHYKSFEEWKKFLIKLSYLWRRSKNLIPNIITGAEYPG